MAHVYVSLGTNINREFYLKQGLDALSLHFGTLTLSSLFESEAVGFDGKPFYNMAIGFETRHSVEQVSEILRAIEFANGRSLQAKKFSPRTLDLDMLLYDQLILNSPVQIPRHEITENAFVLWPLAEIAPDFLHPKLGCSYRQLWAEYDKSKQHLQAVPLHWQQKVISKESETNL